MRHRILVVDDDLQAQGFMQALLTDAGYEVTAAGTFPAALEALTGNPPDLVVADIRLDGYNGLQLIATCPTPVPAIIVTGFDDPVLANTARELGADHFVKPLSPPVLLRRIRERLAGGSPVAAATRRWTRKTLASGLPAYAGSFPARVIEVSHGGLRFEIERLPGQYLPLVFSVTLPMADLRVGVEVAWKKNRSGTAHWVCGASVSENRPLWRGFVDSLPADGLSPAR